MERFTHAISRRFLITLFCGFAIFALVGAGQPTTVDEGLIQCNDLLSVGVDDLDLSGAQAMKSVRVDGDGAIGIYLAGQVKVAGMSAQQAVEAIKHRYVEMKLLTAPAVSLDRLETAEHATVKAAPIAVGDQMYIRIVNVPGSDQTVERTLVLEVPGTIDLPLLEAVQIAGKSEAAAEQEILKAYRSKELTAAPLVSILRIGASKQPATTPAGK